MDRFILIAALALFPVASSAIVVRENNINVHSTAICWVSKSARIFSFPKKNFHLLSLWSTHWVTDVNNRVQDLHSQAKLAWETDSIETGDTTVHGIWAVRARMATEFYTEQSIANGILELEVIRHNDAAC